MGFEPTTSTLARSHSTAELFPQRSDDVAQPREGVKLARTDSCPPPVGLDRTPSATLLPVPAVSLEPLSRAHAPRIQELAAHPAILSTTLLPSPYPPDGAMVFAAYAERAFVDGRERNFAIVSEADGVVGTCGLRHAEERTAELGYWVGVPFWGRGYGRFAARTLVGLAPSWGYTRVTAIVLEDNLRSLRTLESAGLVRVGATQNDKHDRWPKSAVLVQYALTIDAAHPRP